MLQQVKQLLRELCSSFGMEEPPDLDERLNLSAVPPVINGSHPSEHVCVSFFSMIG